MKELVEFMGPKLQQEELSRIWHMADKASPHVVDNIHRIMAAAATRFNPQQFDHLLSLVRKVGDFHITWVVTPSFLVIFLRKYFIDFYQCDFS